MITSWSVEYSPKLYEKRAYGSERTSSETSMKACVVWGRWTRVGIVGFPPTRYGQHARYNKTIPVVAYATGMAAGREGPNPVGYKCRSGCFLHWTVVRHLLHLHVDSITTPPTIPTKLASRIPSGPSLFPEPSPCPPLALERPVFFERDENRVSRPGIHLALVHQPTISTTNFLARFCRTWLNVGETALEIARLEGRTLKEPFLEYNGYTTHNSDHSRRSS